MPLVNITQHEISKYSITKDHLHNNTLYHHVKLVKSLLNVAHRNGWLANVPNIKGPRLITPPFKYLETPEEVSKLLDEAQKSGYYGALEIYATAVYTGMRVGELSGLTWDDIDFTNRLIKVSKSYDGPTKSGHGRIIPILDSLLSIL